MDQSPPWICAMVKLREFSRVARAVAIVPWRSCRHRDMDRSRISTLLSTLLVVIQVNWVTGGQVRYILHQMKWVDVYCIITLHYSV